MVPKTVTAEELPGPSRQASNPRNVWVDRLNKAKVQERPGIWFRVLECENADKAANHARNIRHGRVLLPPGRWDAAARTEEDHSYVWVRFLGD